MGTDQAAAAGTVSGEPRRHEENRRSRRRILLYTKFFVFLVFLLRAFVVPRAQESGKTVADGVYTDAQAARGAAVYDTACAGCHRADLGGGTGPALRDQRFARQFAGKDLRAFFTKIATTMPRNAPASLGDNVYLDIVAHLLKENGFPAGSQELTADTLDGVRVLPGRSKPAPPIGGAPGPQHTWLLTHASEPVVPAAGAPPPASAAAARPLGGATFHLLDAMAYAPETHAGHKMYVRGLLIKLPDEQRIAISAFEEVAGSCE